MANGKEKPVHEIRMGRIKAVIWGNETENGGFRHNVQIRRIYKDGEEWKQTNSFGLGDLPAAIRVLELAQSHVESQEVESQPE